MQVLHLIANPEAQALKEAEKSQMLVLAAERDALAAQVAQLQGRLDSLQPGEAADGVMPGGSAAAPRQIAVLEAEKVVLQRQVAEIEKRELRLKEVFRERIQVCWCGAGRRSTAGAESGRA